MREIYFEPAVNYDDALWRAAGESGIDSSYWDIFGREHHASRDTLRSIATALGWDTSSFEALECLDQEWPEWARGRSWRAACRACRDALEGWRGARDARRAFLKAAERAGLTVYFTGTRHFYH